MVDRRPRRSSLIKSEEEIDLLRKAADIVSGVHEMMRGEVKEGVRTLYLDNLAEQYIRDHGAEPAFKGYVSGGDVEPFPATLCVSVNDVVVHGIPDDYQLRDGDIVTVDVGAEKEGFFGDCAYTHAVGNVSEDVARLLRVTMESLELGARAAIAGNWVYDIAKNVQSHVEGEGFSVVRELVGHGIGTSLHEEPSVPNFVPNPFARHRYRNQKLEAGVVICIEPMVNMGTARVETDEDGWTVRTADRAPAAHFEHMVVVREGKPEVLTTHIPRLQIERVN